jgi:hypothetical protein
MKLFMVIVVEKITEEDARSDAGRVLERVFDETEYYFGLRSPEDFRRLKSDIIRSVKLQLSDAAELIYELTVWVEDGYRLTKRDAATYLASDLAIRLAMNRLGIDSWVMSKNDALRVLYYAGYILRKAEEMVEKYADICEKTIFGER